MIIKFYDLKKFNLNSVNYYLFYGRNLGLIEDTINNIFKSFFSKSITRYEESEILTNTSEFKESIINKSFFENEKFIIINRVSDKLFEIIKEIIERDCAGIKIILKASSLEKKSKLRSFFEKEKKLITVPFYEDNNASLIGLVQNILKEKKIQLSNEIINLVITRANGNRLEIKNELEKISQYMLTNKSINLEQALKLTNLAENYSIEEMVDYCLSKNTKKTINILNENNFNIEENILVLKTFLYKLKRLKKLKDSLNLKKDIDGIMSTYKPPIFWKDKEIIKQQLKMRSSTEINLLIREINNLELLVKKNLQISNQIIQNFILKSVKKSNNLIL